jgi:hypothetical protein
MQVPYSPGIIARFWAKIDKTGEHWIWQGKPSKKGYGTFVIRTGRRMYAHRFAYQITKGEIPPGRLVCHECDIRLCCKPACLWTGTVADNQRDMANKGRAARGERAVNAKLTDALVVEMRRRYAAGGILCRELASEYGLSRNYAAQVIRGERWKHV